MKNRSFYPRSLIAFLMATGFAVAAVTGIVLYVVPKGNIAHWTGWTLGGLDKDAWGDVHIVTGALFLVAGLLHLYFNWKPLKAYLYSRASQGLNRGWEFVAALALTGFVVVGALQGWPPINYILEFNDWARTDLWASSATVPGGRGRAATPVAPSSANAHDQALDRIAEGIDAALAEAAAKSGDSAPTHPVTETHSPADETHAYAGRGGGGGGRGGGSGFGRMTLAELVSTYGLDYRQVSARLAAEGIPFTEGERLRDIAARVGMTPGELGSLVRGGE